MFHRFLPSNYSGSSTRCIAATDLSDPVRVKTAEQFREARLVRITRGAFTIGLDPFGMLDLQVVVDLLLELGVGVDLVRHGLVKDSSAARDGFYERLGGVIDEPWRR